MFQNVGGEGGSAPCDPGRYFAKLIRFEDGGTGEFGPRVKWIFQLANANKELVTKTDSDEPWEHRELTSTATGPKSKAGPWFEALLGRPLEQGEDGAALEAEAKGKVAQVLLGENTKGYLNVVQMTPVKKAAPAPVRPAPVAVADDEGGF